MAAIGTRIGTAAVRASAASSSPRMLHICGPELSPRGRKAISTVGGRLGCDLSPGRGFREVKGPAEQLRIGRRLSLSGLSQHGVFAAANLVSTQEPAQVGGDVDMTSRQPSPAKPAYPRLLGRAGRGRPPAVQKAVSPEQAAPESSEALAAVARNAFLARQSRRGC
mmetsp:Transcript_41132/g.94618  ORF Transcript_41132/g.94618 Transcript_41132/m.94618 type:complete len:166 (-) Transcript_41132:58-555(-)